ARLRVPAPGPRAPARGPVRRQGSRDEGDGGRARRVQAARCRGGPAARRRARRRLAREGGGPRRRARRLGLAPLAHAHRLDGGGHRGRLTAEPGGMRPVLTPTEMGDADRRTIAAGTPVDVLMERAGRAVAWTVRREMGGTYGRRAVVVCGKGNNGGDGHVAARALREWGVRVDVFTLDDGVDRQLCD